MFYLRFRKRSLYSMIQEQTPDTKQQDTKPIVQDQTPNKKDTKPLGQDQTPILQGVGFLHHTDRAFIHRSPPSPLLLAL